MSEAEGLPVGAVAPDAAASLVRPDGTADRVSIGELVADGPVLLAFYTNDFSPDCVREWCSFRDYEWFALDGPVRVVGASRSRPGTHHRFIDRLDLSFPLYADVDLELARGFDVAYRVFGLLERSRRSAFLLDAERTVRHVWLGDHAVDPTLDRPDLDDLRAAVEEIVGGGSADRSGGGGTVADTQAWD
jgi:peroxiredoxin Q/BCP